MAGETVDTPIGGCFGRRLGTSSKRGSFSSHRQLTGSIGLTITTVAFHFGWAEAEEGVATGEIEIFRVSPIADG